jgi:hypothetical protein
MQDTTASIMTLMLAARDLGLGTCWVGAFSEADVAAYDTVSYQSHMFTCPGLSGRDPTCK